jgi:Uma2 family endonuclease
MENLWIRTGAGGFLRKVRSILQELIPGLLKATLLDIWADRPGWLFGIDLGLYYDSKKPAVSPDGMLCLGVRADPCSDIYALGMTASKL